MPELPPLTEEQLALFRQKCGDNLHKFIACSKAFEKVMRGSLYREEFATFEDFCLSHGVPLSMVLENISVMHQLISSNN
jgi:hypothetical protein